MAELLHGKTTEKIIGAAFEVYRTLGYGFLEKVYKRALQVELVTHDCVCELEHEIDVQYKGVAVGKYFADLFVDGSVIVEAKVAREYHRPDEAQLLNALKATGVRVGLLVNFGRERVEFKRMVF